MTAKTLSDVAYEARLREHLKILWWSRGTPQKELARAVGVSPSQITLRFKGEVRTQPGDAAALLDAMGIDHGEFYDGVGGGFHAEVYVARIAMGRKRQKNYAISDLMAGGPSRPYTADELRTMAEGLQDLRIVDPEAARVQALDVLTSAFHHGVDPGVDSCLAALLNLAAVYRARGSWGTAAAYLLKALHMAGRHGKPRARVLHTMIAFANDMGDLEVGLEAAASAASEYARLADFHGQGRVLVSKGNLLGQHGRLDAAIEAFRASLPWVAEGRWYESHAALHGLALGCTLKGSLAEALDYADHVISTSQLESLPPEWAAEARWLRAEILLRMGSAEGISDLRTVLDFWSREHVNKQLLGLLSLRLACAYHDHGMIEEAGKLAAGLIPQLRSAAAGNKLLRGALAELESMTARGELSRSVLQRTYGAVLRANPKAPSAAHLFME